MHENSLQCFKEEAANLGRRALEVHAWLEKHGPATDRQVKNGMGFDDMNCVRPRITALIDAGWAVEICKVTDQETKKKVRLVKAVTQQQQQQTELPL
jgi:hypothetical protein